VRVPALGGIRVLREELLRNTQVTSIGVSLRSGTIPISCPRLCPEALKYDPVQPHVT